MDNTVLDILIIGAGLFSICGGAFDWDFFMNSRKAQLPVKLFGRNGARVMYIVLGLFIAGLGVGFMTGMVARHS